MAQYSYPFDSINKDRLFNSEKDRNRFKGLISNGVLMKSTNKLQVEASTGMKVNVKEGVAWIEGAFYYNDADLPLTIATADTVNPRIDTIALKFDLASRSITAVVKKGTASAKPTPVSLIRNVSTYEIVLAYITVNKGAGSISNADIIDKRFDNSVCGIVTGLIDQIDTTNLFNQFTNSFDEWFETIKEKLNGDIAGNLQNQIDVIHTDVEELKNQIVEHTVYNKGLENEQVVTRYANGEMEIRLVFTPNRINITQPYGGFKISDVIPQVNFKTKFVGTPIVTHEINGRSKGCRVWLIHDWNISVNPNSTMSLLACSGENVTDLTLRIGYIAKGWWK
ncbi:MAG: hypothetical protein ACRDDY_02505 [Clostridium sp.]|uniref:hypothetical protein n=1 Tax=Clostridium sp. TaxID=1506 RepID=UPI003EE46743